MTCSNSAANARGFSKQDNTNGTCATEVEKIIVWLANNTVNKITEIMTYSKSRASASDHANEATLMVYDDDIG